MHAITQALRAVARIAAPVLVFKAEAIVAPDQLLAYLGSGTHAGKVSDLAYHNSLMVQIWSALAARDGRLMVRALRRFPPKPTTAAWATYLRCHDDIGWAVDDLDAAELGWSGFAHRAFLSDFYAGEAPGSFARGAVFQHNPDTGDRRISGSAASLAGVEAALAHGDADELDLALDRLACAHAIVFGFGGRAAALHGRRAGAAQRPHLHLGPGARRRQPVAAPPAAVRGPSPSDATTRPRSRAAPSRRSSGSRGPGPASTLCTPPSRPSCSSRGTRLSSSPYVGTPPAPSSRSSTSPTTRR